jgi:UDP-glucose 4-epimerase
MVIPRLVTQALAGEELTVYGDGSQARCFGHIDDAIDALVRLAGGGDEVLGKPFNVGNPDN